jgi:hypothetical protein
MARGFAPWIVEAMPANENQLTICAYPNLQPLDLGKCGKREPLRLGSG